MSVVLLVFALLTSFAAGALTAIRFMPRIVGRLNPTERAAFARQVAIRSRR